MPDRDVVTIPAITTFVARRDLIYYSAEDGRIWLRLGGDFEIFDFLLTDWGLFRLPRRCAPRNDGGRAPRRLRLLGIFLDRQAPTAGQRPSAQNDGFIM